MYPADTLEWDNVPVYIGKNLSSRDADLLHPSNKKLIGLRNSRTILEFSLMGLLLEKQKYTRGIQDGVKGGQISLLIP